MNKAESKFFQSFKERTGKNPSKLTSAIRRKAKKRKSQRPKRIRISPVAELKESFEALTRNYQDLRKKFEAEILDLKRQLFEEREASKRLRKEMKSTVRGKAR